MGNVDPPVLELPCLDGLEEWERRKIISVLQRDLDIQKQKELQIKHLKEEVRKLSERLNDADVEKCCHRCRAQFGLLVNSGAPCPKCRARVCVGCRVQNDGCRLGWICLLCDKIRQYAVLTGEWIQPNAAQAIRCHTLTKSISSLALRVRSKPHTENAYFPTAATEPSISGILLRHFRQQSLQQSWGSADTERMFAQKLRSRVDSEKNEFRSRSPSSTATQGKSVGGRNVAKDDLLRSSTKHVDTVDKKNAVPILRVHHVQNVGPESRAKTSRPEPSSEQTLSVFSRGIRCPSVPGNLSCENVSVDNSSASLLSVHNVRISIRSTSSDNVSTTVVNAPRETESTLQFKQNSDNNIPVSVQGSQKQGNMDKKLATAFPTDFGRPISQNSAPSTNDISESCDDEISFSDESVASFGSSFVGASVAKHPLQRMKNQSSGSFTSGYSSKRTPQGEVLLSCNYNCANGSLEIYVFKCRNLYPMNAKKNRSNPYVRVYLLPDLLPLGKRKTHLKRHTVDPEYNETFKFTGLTKSEVEARTLLISVWHCDVLGRSHFLGEARLRLADYPWIPDEMYWIELGPHMPNDQSEKKLSTPDMRINVKFTCPDVGKRTVVAGSLQCLVRCPENLPSDRVSSVYVKSYLYPDRSKVTKQKSPLLKLGADPNWNHCFVYDDVTVEDLRERCLELTVWAHHRVGTNEFLGGIRLNFGIGYAEGQKVDWMDSNEVEQNVWKQALSKPNVSVDATIPLRSNMESKL